MLFVLEALKEAGARTPGAMGQTMSIVGGLVDVYKRQRLSSPPTAFSTLSSSPLDMPFCARSIIWNLIPRSLNPVSYTHLTRIF